MSRITALRNMTKNNEIYNHKSDVYNDTLHRGPTGCVGLRGFVGPTGCVGPTGSTYASEILNLQNKTTQLAKGCDSSTIITGNLTVNGEIAYVKNSIIFQMELIYPSRTTIGTSLIGLNVSCSSNGQYLSICASGCIYVSNDYGSSFTRNIVNCIGYAISMSYTGKYQCCVSTNIPKSYILNSTDYGVTWYATSIASSSVDKWSQTVSMSPNGQYIYCGCGGSSKDGTMSYSSNDYGSTFRYGNLGHSQDSSVVSNDGYVLTAGVGSHCYSINLNNPQLGLPIIRIGTDTGPISLSSSVDNDGWILVSNEGLFISKTRKGLDIAKVVPPAQFQQIQFSTGIIWARSNENVWSSCDGGHSWKIVYTGNPRTFAASQDGTILYILSNSGDIITRRIQNTSSYAIGYTLKCKTDKVFFTNTQNSITGTTLSCIPPGVWSISFGWKMSTEGKQGNGQNYNVVYGLSKLSSGFDVLEVNGLYNIFYNDPTTFQSYYHNIVLVLTSNTSLFLNGLLNNNSFPNNNSTIVDTTMINSYINATLIS